MFCDIVYMISCRVCGDKLLNDFAATSMAGVYVASALLPGTGWMAALIPPRDLVDIEGVVDSSEPFIHLA